MKNLSIVANILILAAFWISGVKAEVVKKLGSDMGIPSSFGYSVDISGNWSIVGSPYVNNYEGVAYLYQRVGSDTWNGPYTIEATDFAQLQEDDWFGRSVAISGSYAIVGAPNMDSTAVNTGAAYIYRNILDDVWDDGTKIAASDAAEDDLFGNSVDIFGDYAIVGAPQETGGDLYAGTAYIFHRTDTNTWTEAAKIVASDAEAYDNFGYSVAISGDLAIVGAIGESEGAGAVYIYRYIDPETWDEVTKITATDGGDMDDSFGISLAISGDYIIVGAAYDDSINSNAGAAYIFHQTDPDNWDIGTKITAADGGAEDIFGLSVDISGDYAIVGAPLNNAGAGAAYSYHRTGINTWDAEPKILAYDAAINDNFGWSAAISNAYAIVGAPNEYTGPAWYGAIYIYYPDPAAIELLCFNAERLHEEAKLSWITGTEIDCGAFTILRCAGYPESCVLNDYIELDMVIPCKDSVSGAKYSVLDPGANPAESYSYILREYETTGGLNHYGAVFLPAMKDDEYDNAIPDYDPALDDDDDSPHGDDSSDEDPPNGFNAKYVEESDDYCGRGVL